MPLEMHVKMQVIGIFVLVGGICVYKHIFLSYGELLFSFCKTIISITVYSFEFTQSYFRPIWDLKLIHLVLN